uniref:Uncharacterized protein n=1 Tax=Arundo donax TaxID=35708 RepID=A0A0A9FCF8_ARUDO
MQCPTVMLTDRILQNDHMIRCHNSSVVYIEQCILLRE